MKKLLKEIPQWETNANRITDTLVRDDALAAYELVRECIKVTTGNEDLRCQELRNILSPVRGMVQMALLGRACPKMRANVEKNIGRLMDLLIEPDSAGEHNKYL